MNELPPSPDLNPGSVSGSPASSAHHGASNGSGKRPYLIYLALLILALLLAGQWWSTRNQVKSLKNTLAQRMQAGETLNNETRVLAKSVLDNTKELQAKVNVLESKQAEAQNQQLALEQLYLELSKTRDDWALAEVEQVLSTASQQLQLAGNVQGALIALQNADRLLSRSDKPQFITIRRAIARDQEKLQSLPVIDLTGMALRLDSIISQIDSLPLLSDEKPVVAANEPKNSERKVSDSRAAGQGNTGTDWVDDLRNKWDSLASEIWTEIKQIVRVRQVDTPDALLLSPTQAYYARENLKLRLLNARLALLSRNESAFRNDMIAAQDTLVKYFDTRAKQTQTVLALLKQIQNNNLSIEMPTLAESLNAVRNYKATP